jgi:hypothetical protein
MPDQPWTAWWEIDDTQLQAPREIRHGAPGTAARNADTAEHRASIAVVPEAAEPVPVDYDADPYEFPHVDATGGGGLRRIDVSTPDAQAPPTAEPPARVQAAENWGLVETAAAGAAIPVGVQTVYGRFSVEGVANRPGDLVFTGVTFPDPVSAIPAPGAIELAIDDAANVAPDGVVVADMGGFTADRLGFTLITTALDAGPVRVDGHYVVEI